jgi:hypothetical protein
MAIHSCAKHGAGHVIYPRDAPDLPPRQPAGVQQRVRGAHDLVAVRPDQRARAEAQAGDAGGIGRAETLAHMQNVGGIAVGTRPVKAALRS